MFKITYQVRTYCEMQQMGWEEWQQAMQTAKDIVMKYRQMLADAAEMQAIRAVNHILGRPDHIRFDIMPAAIFTDPEAACVGPTEDQLKAQGIPYVCKKSFWRANGKALAMGETEGLLKLFAQSDGLVLGCHSYGAHSADIIQEVSVLMCKHTTISELADMVHIHPTLSEILKSAVE